MLLFTDLIESCDNAFPERRADRAVEEKLILQNLCINNVRIDSREVEKGDLFVCLPGDRVHGHSFIEQAVKNGAIAALVEEDYVSSSANSIPLVRVPDTLSALQSLAKNVVEREQPEIIAITGAMGKTTTRQFLFHLLEGQKEVEEALYGTSSEGSTISSALSEMAENSSLGIANPEGVEALSTLIGKARQVEPESEGKASFIAQSSRNFNSQAGLPVTILNELQGYKLWILEMAMSEPGNLKTLVHIAPPSYALITFMPAAIEDYVHAAAFETIEDAVHAKCEIFESEKLKMAFIPDDLPDLETTVANIYADRCLFSFTDPLADFFCEIIEDNTQITEERKKTSVAIYEKREKKLEVDLYFPKHHIRNFFIAIVIARALGLSWEKIEKRKGNFSLPPMRFEVIEKGGVTIISDAYNASPEAMRLAIEAMPDTGGKKLAVLGEVLMLGAHAFKGHEKALRFAEQKLDHVFCYGKNWEGLEGNFTLFQNKEDVVQTVLKNVRPGDVVLIKGSRGCALEEVVSGVLSKL